MATIQVRLPHFIADSSRNIRILYAIRALKDIVFKLTFFFIPLYLYQLAPKVSWLGWSVLTRMQQGVVLVALYYLVSRVVIVLTVSWQAKIMAKLGPSRSLSLGLVATVLAMAILTMSSTYPSLVFIASLVQGVAIPFFWVTIHTVFARDVTPAHLGQDLGVLNFVISFTTMVTPAIGGLLIVTLGYNSVLWLGSVLLLGTVLIAHQLDQPSFTISLTTNKIKKWLQQRKSQIRMLSFIGVSWYEAAIMIWPLYIFLLLGTVEKVGYVYSLSLFLAMLLSFGVGFYLDSSKNRKPFIFSGGLVSALWIVRAFVVSPWGIAITDAFSQLAGTFYWIWFGVADLTKSKRSNVFEYMVFRELVLSVGHVVFWLLLLLGMLSFNSWQALFAIGAVGVLLSFLMHDTSEG